MNPARLEAFALAYAPALLAAVAVVRPTLQSGEKPEDYVLQVSMDMLDMIQAKGIAAVEHYYLNTKGGALQRTCETLGIENTTRAMQNYLDGL